MKAIEADPEDIETVEEGWFRYRAMRGAPFQAVRVLRLQGRWYAWINGVEVPDAGKPLAKDIPFLLWHAPFHPISRDEYDRLLAAYRKAPAGHPLTKPGEAVDFRSAPGLYRGKK